MPERVLNLLLTHQGPAQVAAMLAWWQRRIGVAPGDLLIAYGGPRESFEKIAHPHKVISDDPRLRTHDHQRERQSYHDVMRAAAAWLESHPEDGHTHVYFTEFDHVPLVAGLNRRQVDALDRERADVLALRLARIDGSSHPHYLYHAADPAFLALWKSFSRRTDAGVVLSILGTGSFWTREAFVATAAVPETVSVYLELFLPTAAHHLGYRVRPFPDAGARACIYDPVMTPDDIPAAEALGAWTIHPVKSLWDAPGV